MKRVPIPIFAIVFAIIILVFAKALFGVDVPCGPPYPPCGPDPCPWWWPWC